MDTTIARGPASSTAVFEDGLGRRYELTAANGDPLSVLVLSNPFITSSGLEAGLRAQLARLGTFQHPSFSRIHRVARVVNSEGGIAVVSEAVRGWRLSTLLSIAETRSMPLDLKAAWWILGQLVSSVAVLHERVPGFYHGAIAPERIIVTPTGRVVVVEHLLGASLANLHCTRQQYWRMFKVALPQQDDLASFDQRSDVAQLGAVALALLLGHPLGADYPARVGGRAEGASNLSAAQALELLPDGIQAWMSRALQLNPDDSFVSASQARAALDLALDDTDYIGAPEALAAFLEACDDRRTAPAPPVLADAVAENAAPAAAVPSAAPAALQSALPSPLPATPDAVEDGDDMEEAARPAEIARMPEVPTAAEMPRPVAVRASDVGRAKALSDESDAEDVEEDLEASHGRHAIAEVKEREDVDDVEDEPEEEDVEDERPRGVFGLGARLPFGRRESGEDEHEAAADPYTPFNTLSEQEESRWSQWRPQIDWRAQLARGRVAAAIVAVVLAASATTFAARQFFKSATASAPTGTLSLVTDPPGAMVTVDGDQRGITPLRIEVEAGEHMIELANENGRRALPVTLAAGAQLSQVVEMPKGSTAPVEGQLQVRTDPSGARVLVDGQLRGTSPVTVPSLSPGNHTVTVVGEEGTVSEQVTVAAGAVTSLVVPLNTAPRAPLSGWIAVKAPAEIQLYEGERLLGSSRTDRIMASAGRHEIDLVNEALGFRVRQVVNVAAGQVATITPTWPNGSVALNALPWADVWIDGERVGETPIGNMPVPIGRHEILFRHPELGEQRQTAVVTTQAPVRLSIDLRRTQR